MAQEISAAHALADTIISVHASARDGYFADELLSIAFRTQSATSEFVAATFTSRREARARARFAEAACAGAEKLDVAFFTVVAFGPERAFFALDFA
jgi:hypothetical protein